MLLPDSTFYMRKRIEEGDGCSIDGDNPFVWDIKTSKDLFENKKVLIFGLPGAFTPTCTNSQLPGFEELYEDFMQKGIDEIWCTSVNDAFTMFQWAKNLGIEKVKMLPDGNGDFAEALGVLKDKSNLGFGKRSWRYAMLVDNLEFKNTWVEPGLMDNCPTDPYSVSNPQNVLGSLND